MTEAEAYAFVARWHEQQAILFQELAKDEPRIDKRTRDRAAIAAKHHAGSAAALRNKAHGLRGK